MGLLIIHSHKFFALIIMVLQKLSTLRIRVDKITTTEIRQVTQEGRDCVKWPTLDIHSLLPSFDLTAYLSTFTIKVDKITANLYTVVGI